MVLSSIPVQAKKRFRIVKNVNFLTTKYRYFAFLASHLIRYCAMNHCSWSYCLCFSIKCLERKIIPIMILILSFDNVFICLLQYSTPVNYSYTQASVIYLFTHCNVQLLLVIRTLIVNHCTLKSAMYLFTHMQCSTAVNYSYTNN